jgi:hypothetical protein
LDAPFTLARLIAEFNALIRERDFEGAEELLTAGLNLFPANESFLHFQFGRLYREWNKLTSAINHLIRAVELCVASGDEILQIQVLEELKTTRESQLGQCP